MSSNNVLVCQFPTGGPALTIDMALNYCCFNQRTTILVFFFFKDFIYLFLERGEGKEKERERNINVWLPLMRPYLGTWPATQACALTRNQTNDPLVHPPNPQSTEPHQPGPHWCFNVHFFNIKQGWIYIFLWLIIIFLVIKYLFITFIYWDINGF